MCIICISPKGTKLPDLKTRRIMWYGNPDGAGIMYVKHGAVYIDKGFMTFDAMERRIADLEREIDTVNTPVIMHYRITTHGGTKPENTHPFPCTKSLRSLRATHTRTNLGIAHNGIIPIKTRAGISDTMEYIADVLAGMPKHFYQDMNARNAIEHDIAGSRLALLDRYGMVIRIGKWQKGEDGCWYSNGNYKVPSYTYRGYRSSAFLGAYLAGELDSPTEAPWDNDIDDTGDLDDYKPYCYYEDSFYTHGGKDYGYDEDGDDSDDDASFRRWLNDRHTY